MDQYEFIRVANRVYGKGIREIAREFGHYRKTVRKATAGMKPEYRMKKARKSPVMDAVREMVDEWLRKDQGSPKKQKLTAKQFYERLKGENQSEGAEAMGFCLLKNGAIHMSGAR